MHAARFDGRARVAILALLAVLAGAMLAFALLSGGTSPAQAAAGKHHPAHHVRHHVRSADPTGGTDPDNVQSGDQTSPDTGAGGATSSSDPTGGTDPDNVQSGDQTTPDTGSSATTSGTDPSGETSSPEDGLQPGEPAGGHQDAPGQNVDNNCVDGNGCSG